jgi:UrcA family protein
VDLADARQVKVFYDHIRVAARAACNSDSLTPWGVREDRECRARFVDDAVNQVNAPLLTAMNSPDSRKTPTSAYAFGDQ